MKGRTGVALGCVLLLCCFAAILPPAGAARHGGGTDESRADFADVDVSFHIGDRHLYSGERTTITVTLHNEGFSTLRELTVTLYDRREWGSSQVLHRTYLEVLKPGGEREIKARFRSYLEGEHQIRLRIEDPDRVYLVERKSIWVDDLFIPGGCRLGGTPLLPAALLLVPLLMVRAR
ncbi:MAG: hypothetical protein K9L28_01910 [Synergistales bacterium]|nr:hypothetical protein [Synergistales bacterium]